MVTWTLSIIDSVESGVDLLSRSIDGVDDELEDGCGAATKSCPNVGGDDLVGDSDSELEGTTEVDGVNDFK